MNGVWLVRMLVLVILIGTVTACDRKKGDTAAELIEASKPSAATVVPALSRAIPELPAAADVIDVIRRHNTDTPAGDLSARSLQGLVNKKQPRVYIQDDWTREGTDVEQIRQKLLKLYGGKKLNELPTSTKYDEDQTFWTLFEKYQAEVKRLYVFDEQLPDTINVAAMLAGRNQGIAVSLALAEQLKAYGLPVTDVKAEYGFTDHIQINRWIGEHMVEGSNKQTVFVLSPRGRDEHSDWLPEAYDLAIATDSLIYHINPFLPTEVKIQQEILDQFPDNTLVLGWAGADVEGDFVKSVSSAGKSVVCTDWGYPNGSIWASFTKFTSTKLQPAIPEDYQVVDGKTYVAFTVSDGDAWHYASRDLLAFWNQPVRGKVPIGWTVPSLFSEGNPLIMRYLYNTKTDNDEFMQGPSGFGYVYAGKMPEQAYESYLQTTKRYMSAMGLNMVNYWDLSAGNNSMVGNDESLIEKYIQTVKPEAIFRGHDGDGSYKIMDGTVVAQEAGDLAGAGTKSADDVVKAIERVREATPLSQPSFVMVNIEAWGDGVSTIEAAVDTLLDRDERAYVFLKPSEWTGAVKAYAAGKSRPLGEEEPVHGAESYTVTFAADGGADEMKYMFVDKSSGLFNDEHRFADNGAYWIYKIPLLENYRAPRLTLDISGQYQVSVSTDGRVWTIVKASRGVEGRLNVHVDLKKQFAGHSRTLYLKIADAVPTDGFGPSLFRFNFTGRAD